MRILLAAILAVHGSIHLLGLAKALAQGPNPRAKLVGAIWLLACLVLALAAVLAFLRVRSWWWVAAIGVALSQVLIMSAWSKAMMGTLVNALLAVPIVVAWGDARFQAASDAAVRALFARVPAEPGAVVTPEELAGLPPPVRRWLEGSGVVGKPRVRSVRLRQRGGIRTAPDQTFMPAEAQQYFAVDRPGFVWRVRVKMMRVLPVVGRDTYLEGKGRMRIEAASLVPIVDGTGDKLDQGTLLRYLGEIIWFPSAALSPTIRWESIDADAARATMTYRGVSASGVFRFAADGRFLSMTAHRYMGTGERATLEECFFPARDWKRMNDILIPVEGDAVWRLPGGDFNYYQWEIVGVEYDRPALYPDS
jgi:hypothetical protein